MGRITGDGKSRDSDELQVHGLQMSQFCSKSCSKNMNLFQRDGWNVISGKNWNTRILRLLVQSFVHKKQWVKVENWTSQTQLIVNT